MHVADSLSGLEVADLSSARRIADVGSGPGFPGLVLAVALPRARVDLIEAAGRKTAVIDRLIQAAQIGNARSVTARVEEWGRAPFGRGAYDCVTARAVAALPVLVEYAAPLLRSSGVFVAWKGAVEADELRLGKGAGALRGACRSRRCCRSSRMRGRGTATWWSSARPAPTPDRFPAAARDGRQAARFLEPSCFVGTESGLQSRTVAGFRRSGANRGGDAGSDRPEP